MAEPVIEVFLCRGFSGQIVRLALPAQIPLEQLLGELLQQLNLPLDPEVVGVYNLTQDFEYLRTDTLAQRGTRPGDLVLVAPGGECRRWG
ncbi:hypothetical protein HRbin21_00646 [bacterium HR21]|nr:hypothetical protein HRbin21_00646 [bacterium HR21]